MILALLGLAAIIAFVAAPLVRPSRASATDARASDLQALERRDRALTALRELEFDHRTGKISDEDYDALRGPLRRDAADALQSAGGTA